MSPWKKIMPVMTLSFAAAIAVAGCAVEQSDEAAPEAEVTTAGEQVSEAQQALYPVDVFFLQNFCGGCWNTCSIGPGPCGVLGGWW